VKSYELQVEGYHTALSGQQIGERFRAGRVRRSDKCREVGAREWRTIDELLPLLKYDSSGSSVGLPPIGRRRTASAFDGQDQASEVVRSMSSALKAGWICFGIGLAISWFFPFGHMFFSIAVITAVVAMCTHQVNRGLALLISSFVASGLCALIFFTLVLGTIGVATGAALKQARENMQRQAAQQRRAVNQMSAANRQPQAAVTNAFVALPAPGFAPTAPIQQAANSFDQQQQYDLATARGREQQQRAAADEQKRQQNIRDAERQRDLARTKEQERQRLQKSVDWWDAQVKDARLRGASFRWLETQRENAWKQKQEFERK
jgi:Sec-independent protein translocase protein TatA